MGKILTKDLILSALDLPTKDVDVAEWGGTVRVRAMTGAERDKFEASMLTEQGESRGDKLLNLRARLCALTMVGEDGITPLFTAGDVEALGKKSSRALNAVFNAARELSGFTEKDVEEMEKN